jgi:hypothetical protein
MTTVTIITGPQGSGNHLFAKVLSLHPSVGGWKELQSEYWVGHDKEPYAKLWEDLSLINSYPWHTYLHHVISISCPYFNNGELTVPNYTGFVILLKQLGLSVNIGIIGRDASILQAQQKRVRGVVTLPMFLSKMDVLLNEKHVFLSHELLMLYRYQYLQSVAAELELKLDTEDNISKFINTDTNEKYVSYVSDYWLDNTVRNVSSKWK